MTKGVILNSVEPGVEQFPNQFVVCIAATRPAFILASVIPVFLGLSFAIYQGYPLDGVMVKLILLAGILLHAAINVLNDYYDVLNGTDEANSERVYLYTGGSRFIQNGVLSKLQMLSHGIGLILVVIMIGIYLISQTGSGLFWLGLAGLLLGWGYSTPPLRLNSRGLGEFAVLAGFGLIPLGAGLVQTGEFLWELIVVALPLALLTTNLLHINQFPDRKVDIVAGKLHWVARFGSDVARVPVDHSCGVGGLFAADPVRFAANDCTDCHLASTFDRQGSTAHVALSSTVTTVGSSYSYDHCCYVDAWNLVIHCAGV